MMSTILNRCWLLAGYRDYAYFKSNMNEVAAVQSRKLMELLALNQDTAIGREYSFQDIRDYRQFAATLPLVENYEMLDPYIQQISNGEEDVLFPGRPAFFETTSGSTRMSKLIPYTAQLKSEFQTAVNVWMNDLYRTRRGVFDGPAYWSVSPQMKDRGLTPGGISVGTTSDTAYFHPLTARLMQRMLVPSPNEKHSNSPHQFYLTSWRNLIQRKNLRFISVWSPNFLLRLHAFLRENVDEILDDPSIAPWRRQEVTSICRGSFTFLDLFPQLKLLSCWTQSQAKLWLDDISDILGAVDIQGKGLLSTEGIVSIPMSFDRHVLAYTSHFFEFRDVQDGSLVLADELRIGSDYEVIITTGGGLYRYCTGDWVTCVDYQDSLPCLEFIGRGASVSDLVGEKLNANLLPDIFLEIKNQASQAIQGMHLYGRVQERQAGYLLLIEGDLERSETVSLSRRMEDYLRENPYYGQAITNGQLIPLEPVVMSRGFHQRLFEFYCQKHQIKEGDAKIPVLFQPGALKELLGY